MATEDSLPLFSKSALHSTTKKGVKSKDVVGVRQRKAKDAAGSEEEKEKAIHLKKIQKREEALQRKRKRAEEKARQLHAELSKLEKSSSVTTKMAESYIRPKLVACLNAIVDGIASTDLHELLLRRSSFLLSATSPTAESVVEDALVGWFHASQETKFGQFMEEVTRAVAYMNNGFGASLKSGQYGLDLDLQQKKTGHRFVVSVKSGKNTHNHSSETQEGLSAAFHTRVVKEFVIYIRVQISGRGLTQGQSLDPTKPHYKLSGDTAWWFLSGNPTFGEDLAVLLGTEAAGFLVRRNSTLALKKETALAQFKREFCCADGSLDICKLHSFISGGAPDLNNKENKDSKAMRYLLEGTE